MNVRKTLAHIGLIVLGGLLPVLIYAARQGALGASDLAELQTVNSMELLALTAALFTIKPAYLFLCVAVLIVTWGRASPSARSLFWGFCALLTGEVICGATFFAFRRELIVSEHIHSYGMMVEFVYIAFAAIALIDRRAAQSHAEIRPAFAFVSAVGMLASFLPLAVSPTSSGYHADIFGFPYLYVRYEFNHWVESRALPIASVLFFSLALLSTLRATQQKLANAAIVFLSTGIGLLAFSILRLSLGALFSEHLIFFEFWEETTQFILISTIVFLLWQFKREWIQDRVALFR